MTDDQPSTEPEPGSGPKPIRVGNDERQRAMDALDVHMSAGRLDPDEYGDRVAKASVARTTADLDPLFADLPPPHATDAVARSAGATDASTGARPAASVPRPEWSPPPAGPLGRRSRHKHHGREPLGGRAGEVAVGLSPFVAVILSFATSALGFSVPWLFFLLIPIVGVIVYGRDDRDS